MDHFQTFSNFLAYIENNYEEEEQLIIEDFMSYYINKYRKLGKHNCETTYKENLKNDNTGELHRLSLVGFEFEKKRYDERENNKKSITQK